MGELKRKEEERLSKLYKYDEFTKAIHFFSNLESSSTNIFHEFHSLDKEVQNHFEFVNTKAKINEDDEDEEREGEGITRL